MLNKVFLIGFANSEVYQKDKFDIFFLSTKHVYTDGTGQKQKKYSSHKILVPSYLKNVSKYIQKGSKISIEGRIDYYQKDDNSYSTSIIVNNVLLLGSEPEKALFTQEKDQSQDTLDETIDDEIPF